MGASGVAKICLASYSLGVNYWETYNSPNTVHVGLDWPWRELLWEGADEWPFAFAGDICNVCACGAKLGDCSVIDEFWNHDVAGLVELVEERVRGCGGSHIAGYVMKSGKKRL